MSGIGRALSSTAVIALAAASLVAAVTLHNRPAAAAAATYSVHGIDVSANDNTSTATIDWPTVAQHENFAFIKATEGDSFVSAYLSPGWSQMTSVGIARAPYHFLLSTDAGTVTQQVQHFIAAIQHVGYTGHHSGELPPALDLEWDYRTGGCLTGITSTGVKQFLDTLRSTFGRDPVVYTNNNFLGQCGIDSRVFAAGTYLWQSDYVHSSPPISPGWNTWTMWQYTSSASVPGVPKPCDRSWFNGTLAQLDALANHGGGVNTRDLSGDGIDDVLARSADAAGSLHLYPGNGDGTLAAPQTMSDSGWGNVTAMAVADFTGDGHADVVALDSDGTLNFFHGNGAGGLWSPTPIGTGWGAMVNVVAGDFTGDGRADLIARRNDGGLFLYHGNGNGTFTAPVTLAEPTAGWGNHLTILGGDFDGNGHADLVAETSDYRLVLYIGHGDGAFNAPVEISHGWADMTALIPGDFNHDGRTDILGRSTDGTLRFYPMGTSSLGSGTVIGTGWNVNNLFQS